jgi:hypothetical protein
MGHLVNATSSNPFVLTDLSLPGTHDSFTYDLSLTVSDDGLDDMQALADLLHFLSPGGTLNILPGDLEEFFRLQAKTQQLTITQQLDNGIRFLDCRLMMQQQEEKPWYSIHFMQSKQTVDVYWKEMRQWLDEHPQEVVMIWLSKHGNPQATGEDQYPGVTKEQKKEIWTSYLDIFDGLLMDTRVSGIHKTPVSVLLERNHRVVTFATDYVDFTESSPWALDAAATIQNTYENGDGIFRGTEPYLANHKHYFHHAKANNDAVRGHGGLTLLAMNTQGPPWLIEAAAHQRFLPLLPLSGRKCAKNIHLDGIASWCPRTLLDVTQLSSYYNQVSINRAFEDFESSTFPMAFYLDSLDYDGTIRTGSQLLDGYESPNGNAEHASDSYAYVDTVLAYNTRRVCRMEGNQTDSCVALVHAIDDRRSRHPVSTWSEAKYGRSEVAK